MGQWSRLLLVLWFLQLAVGGGLAADQLCRRLMLTGLREDHTAYYMYAGIYEVQDYLHQGFPVLKRANLIFSYDEPNNRFVIGFAVGKMHGLAVTAQSSLNKRTWLQEARSDEPFSRILKRWYESIAMADTGSYIEGDIRFKCVDDEYQSCDSGKMEFDRALVQNPGQPNEGVVNIPGQFYYEAIPQLYHNNRPVYELKKHSFGNDVKLYYSYKANGWVVGSRFPTHYVAMIAEDHALYPEQIVSEWKYFTNNRLTSTYTKLRCLGVTSEFGKSCNDSTVSCQNGGTCHGKLSGEEICLCEPNFYGVSCEKTRVKCPLPDTNANNPGPGYYDFLNAGNVMGSIGTVFCHKGYEPQYFPIVCAAKADQPALGEWKGIQPCSLVTTVATTTVRTTSYRTTSYTFKPTYDWSWRYPTRKPKSEEPDWAYAVTLSMGLLLQLFLPFCIYWILSIISTRLDKKYAKLKEDQYGILNVQIDPEKRKIMYDFDNGLVPEEETREKKSKLAEKMLEGERHFKEERQKIKAKRKVKNISFCRIYSLAFNIGIWVWIPLIIIGSELDIQSDTLSALWLCGVICLPIGYLWVLCESICSREYEYLSGMNQVEYAVVYLKELRETAPHLVMHAECYHYETRTRTVFYTDANGNMQSRTETYQERVVTHVDSEVFRYGFWVDTSDPRFAFSHDYGVTKIKLKQAIIPGDLDTRTKLSEAEDAFRQKNEHYDVFMDYNLNIVVEGFRKRLAAYVDPNHRSWWIRSRWFWIATFLTYSWPYRWLFRARTGNAKYKLEKHIFMTRPQQAEDVDRDYTAYNVSQEQQSKICQDDKRTSVVEESGADKKDKRKSKTKEDSKKDKGKKLKTDVDLELGGGSVKRY